MTSNDLLRLSARDAAELSRALLGATDRFRIRVHGQSMRPSIRDGDRVVIARITDGEVRRGDILCLLTPGGRVLIHRLIRFRSVRGGVCLTTCGDARCAPDPPAGRQQVLGRVVEIERDDRRRAPDGLWARHAGLAWSGAFRAGLLLRRAIRRILPSRTPARDRRSSPVRQSCPRFPASRFAKRQATR